MKVLITNNNIDLFKEIHPKLKFYASTINTSYFNCSEKVFEKIRTAIRGKNINPYSIMAW